MTQPFLIFPWQQPFLPGLKRLIAERTGGQPGRALLIVPNQRPWRYLCDLYASDRKSGLLPKMLAVSDVISRWSAASAPGPYCRANSLDQIWFLREACLELSQSNEGLARHFANMGLDQFLPWGFRLVALYEEIMAQGREPRDIIQIESEVEPLAQTLLAALGRIGHLWRAKLASQDIPLMTAGLESLQAAMHSDAIPESLRPDERRLVIIAGFSVLNGAEEAIFRSLWQAGALVCLHADAAIARGGPGHPACASQADWLKRWQAGAEIMGDDTPHEPDLSFFAAYDHHSQLKEFVKDLESDGPGTKAIVLPSAGLLMPVLHHLPEKEINISMGYPLKRSQIYSFLDDLLRLQLRRQPDGRYYWQDLVRLFSQPFLRMLTDSQGASLRRPLALLENLIRSGTGYADLHSLYGQAAEKISEAEARFLARSLELLTGKLEQAGTPAQLAACLAEICAFLVERGGRTWRRFPLDLEALSRLQNRILPVLADSRMQASELPKPVLFDLLLALIDQERIPFEADPLVGAQILGLLETRLLHFDTVYILDASEEKLPGQARQDPLLPDALRPVAGLPDAAARQNIVAYNLFRLLASAKKARFYWSEGAGQPDLGGAGAGRSRYVAQLIWARERQAGKLMACGEGQFGIATASARLSRKLPVRIGRSQRLDQAMRDCMAGGLSASALNLYLGCPARFAYEKLLRLRPLRQVQTGDDGGEVGKCIHATLAKLLKPYRGKPLALQEIASEELYDCFEEQLAPLRTSGKLPVDSCMVLERAGKKRLRDYLNLQTEPVTIRELEQEYCIKLRLLGQDYNFTGRLDRVDERDDGRYILDYKTGRLHLPAKGALDDGDFFAGLADYIAGHPVFDEQADELLCGLRERIPDIQMPFYMLMETERHGAAPADACFIDLRETCAEKSFFGAAGKGVAQICETAVGFICRHMQAASGFCATGEGCKHCPYAGVCDC